MQSRERGKLTVIAGPMFAGKTSKLERIVKEYQKRSSGCVVALKASFDHRYSEGRIINHDEAVSGKQDVGIEAISVDPSMVELVALLDRRTLLLAIDEANFFLTEVLLPQVEAVLGRGVDVVVSGLLFDSNKQPFGATGALLELADDQLELSAPCHRCGKPAYHTKRLVADQQQIHVGGAEEYQPCCEACWGQY